METAKRVKSIIAESLMVKPKEVTETANFIEDLGTDSLDTAELVMELEEKFNIEIPDEDVAKLQTVGDTIKYIEKKLSNK